MNKYLNIFLLVLSLVFLGLSVESLVDRRKHTSTKRFLEKHLADIANHCQVKEYSPADDRMTYQCNEMTVVLKLSAVLDFREELEKSEDMRARFFR